MSLETNRSVTGPRVGKALPTILIGIRVSEEQRNALVEYARARGMSMTFAARKLLDEGLQPAPAPTAKPRSRAGRP